MSITVAIPGIIEAEVGTSLYVNVANRWSMFLGRNLAPTPWRHFDAWKDGKGSATLELGPLSLDLSDARRFSDWYAKNRRDN